MCKRWADEDGEKWSSDKELISQGVANLCSAAVGGMTVAGVISRAAFGKVAGARTRLAHAITGGIIIAFIALNGGVPRCKLGPSLKAPSLKATSLKAPSLKAPSLKAPSLKAPRFQSLIAEKDT